MPAASPTVPPPAARPGNERWAEVFGALIKREGDRFTDDPADHGGATKYGITLRTLAQCCRLDAGMAKAYDINHDGAITALDIRGLDLKGAEGFYFGQFWKSGALFALPAPFDGAMLDQAVNDGMVPALRLLQAAYNTLTEPPEKGRALGLTPLPLDGRLGPVTLSAIQKAVGLGLGQALLLSLRHATVHRYIEIAAADPRQRKFLAGWITRAEELGDT